MRSVAITGAVNPSPLGLAVIGAGRWGREHVRVVNGLKNATLVAVCDSNQSRLRPCHEFFKNERPVLLSSRTGPVLSRPDVDAVVIATPPASHARLACEALAWQKHVLLEKPLAVSEAEAFRVLRAERQSGRRLMVGHLLRYHPGVVALHGLIEAGRLGKLNRIECQRLGRRGPHAAGREDSAWWALGPHDVSVARYLAGKEPARVRGRPLGQRGGFAEDAVLAELDFGAFELCARLFVSSVAPVRRRSISVFGSAGSARLIDISEPGQSVARLEVETAGNSPERLSVPEKEPLLAELEHFTSRLEGGRPFFSDVSEGVRVVQILEAASRSLHARQDWVPLPPLVG